MNYIGVYDNTITKKECEILINQFEKSPHTPGIFNKDEVGLFVDESIKKCVQLNGSRFSDNSVISNLVFPILAKYIDKYTIKYPQLNEVSCWRLDDGYNFQKYEAEDDGFKKWHTEHSPNNPMRVLAWMFYLNDAKCGTEFMNYSTIKAKRGRCVIWPAAFTHVHRGVIPNKGLKYIVTGWVSFEK